MAFTGVPFFNGLSETGHDPLSPDVPGLNPPLTSMMDNCLGHVSSAQNFYHYLSHSPCIQKPSLRSADEIPACDTDCKTNPTKYITDESVEGLAPIGISLSGHMMYSPFKDSEDTEWDDCDVDTCNGRMISGKYSYVTTMFHPLTIGCWGPSNSIKDRQVCSTKPKKCNSAPPG